MLSPWPRDRMGRFYAEIESHGRNMLAERKRRTPASDVHSRLSGMTSHQTARPATAHQSVKKIGTRKWPL